MKNKTMLKSRLAVSIASASLFGALAIPAQAIQLQFDNPNISGRLDTTLSAGALFRTQGQKRELAAIEDPLVMAQRGYATQLNKNDGNNNFDTGLASLVGRISSELALDFGSNYGLFVRGTSFYDAVIMEGGHDGGIIDVGVPGPRPGFGGVNRYADFSQHPNNGMGDRFSRQTKDWAGQRNQLLDAYIWGEFMVADRPLTVRAGRQVINWGEALFIQNGINTANYIDLAALRQPGAEIREALLPLTSLYFSYGLTMNLTAEAFYQFDWKNTEDAPAGSFYSTNDAFPGRGANNVVVDGRLLAAGSSPPNPALADAAAAYTRANYGMTGINGYQYEQTQLTVNRTRDDDASDSGQFGLAFRYFADALNGTEFGLFYTRTHAKLPVVGSQFGELDAARCDAAAMELAGLNCAQLGAIDPAAAVGLNVIQQIDSTNYHMAYVEDVDMFGLSFSSNIGNMALSGEIAYRPKQPVINEVGDNLIQALAQTAQGVVLGTATVGDLTNHCIRASLGGSCLDQSTPIDRDTIYYAYDEAKMTNASLVSIFNLGSHAGASNVVFLLEVGAEHAGGLDSRDPNGNKLYYNSTAAIQLGEAQNRTPNDVYRTYLDEFSWGYRSVLRATYSDVLAGVSAAPFLNFAHDVEGNSVIGGNFMENRKAGTLGVNFAYQNNLEVGLAATAFWGAGYSNKLRDRNNVALSMRYAF
ncbi:DUF1302 domain-containing protein [Alcanivorax sp. JB21]|uniref:DUF1302 domain-containing protein n=1 Tax=Alcanivorax limicola TaxID=2874102 RepID=UPI001CBBCFDC|nr:DUF1302 domain-containing protein [Alcanivorax limicola]MBZ2188074.1 DUF1302 domain-containing protein [Alcanivorax limicola]